jgi:hypothetical protein
MNIPVFGLPRSCLQTIAGRCAAVVAVFSVITASAPAQTTRTLDSSINPVALQQSAIVAVPANQEIQLAISLPLRNQALLNVTLRDLNDPDSPLFRQWLTPAEFTAQFGPTAQDVNKVVQFAAKYGLTVIEIHPNGTIVDVRGQVTAVEKAFNVNMLVYRHPTENRTFFGPDRVPSVDQDVPILEVSGLSNFDRPHAKYQTGSNAAVAMITGSGPGGGFMGNDYRAAYAPGVALNGSGQAIGLFEFGGYHASDVSAYCSQARLPNANVTNVLLNGVTGVAAPGDNTIEQTLDIEAAHAMAPAAAIFFYTGTNDTDIWNRMATDNICKSVSSSWGVNPAPATMNQIMQQMAAQGQSVFNASGDSGYITTPFGWDDSPYMIQVGGTSLTTNGPGGPWLSETGWSGSGSVASNIPIPSWQQGISMKANGGSTTTRNTPDVSMVGNIQSWFVFSDGQSGLVGGTSVASPLWAGFLALVNQQATLSGKPTAGFINPAIYAILKASNYTTDFHDITSGNNTKPAVPGYDLVTGIGTPTGQALINDLAGPASTTQVAAPVFIPGGATYSSAQNVTISDSTSGASIRYTLDGSTPSETSGTLYSGPVNIATTTTLEAIGYLSGDTDSNITSATYTITSQPPTGIEINCGGPAVSPFVADEDFTGGGTIDHANTINTSKVTNPAPAAVYQSARVTATAGAGTTFSYTIGGFTPGSDNTVRLHFCETFHTTAGSRVFNVSINGTQVLTNFDIFATAGGENIANIQEFTEPANSSGQYVILFTTVTDKALISGIEIDSTTTTPPPPAAPSFSPAPGSYSSSQSVTISDATAGASIYYTTDGSTPTTASTLYSGPVSIATTTTLQAIANNSAGSSSVTSGTYTITTASGPITLQASNLSPTGSGQAISTATDAKAPGGTWVKIASTAVGQWIQFTTPSIPAGTYSLSFIYRTNTDRAQHNVTIDGTQVGTTIVDQYAPGATATYPPAVTIGSVTFGTAGTHTIRLTATGKNAASTSYQISAVQFIFQ